MSSFDPPLSRITAAVLTLGATMVIAWVLYVAHYTSHMSDASDAKSAVPTDKLSRP